MAAQVAEEYKRLLDLLPDESSRKVAEWKLEGYTNAEIAAKWRRGGHGRMETALHSRDLGKGDRAMGADSPGEYERLIALLPDGSLRKVAEWKLEGYTNAEIAARAGARGSHLSSQAAAGGPFRAPPRYYGHDRANSPLPVA
jgi:DNA-directed RNA polymerase specialized sigma24 family protein